MDNYDRLKCNLPNTCGCMLCSYLFWVGHANISSKNANCIQTGNCFLFSFETNISVSRRWWNSELNRILQFQFSNRNFNLQTISKMNKFRVLERSQNFMTRLAISSHRLSEPTNEFFTRFMAYYITFLLFAFSAASGGVVYKYWPDLSLVLQGFAMVLAGLQCGGVYVSIGFQMKNIKKLNNELQTIVDKGMKFICSSKLLQTNCLNWLNFTLIRTQWRYIGNLLGRWEEVSMAYIDCYMFRFLEWVSLHRSAFVFILLHLEWRLQHCGVESTILYSRSVRYNQFVGLVSAMAVSIQCQPIL